MHRTSSRVLLIVAAFVLFLVPVAAIAAGGFTDVDDDSVFKADIAWLADAGVTKGCNPPTNTKFCPEGNVTREQMAAFMHRLAVNKVVDAKTALTAGDANLLDGKDSTAFAVSGHGHDTAYLAKAGKAADANLLDGFDSTAFAKASNVYTKAEIDSSTASTPIGGGALATDGTLHANYVSFGDFTTARPSTGFYVVEFPGLAAVGCSDPYPIVNATGVIDSHYGGATMNCITGDVEVYIYMRNQAGALVDSGFMFTAYWTESGLSPAVADERKSASYCTIDGETGVVTCE